MRVLFRARAVRSAELLPLDSRSSGVFLLFLFSWEENKCQQVLKKEKKNFFTAQCVVGRESKLLATGEIAGALYKYIATTPLLLFFSFSSSLPFFIFILNERTNDTTSSCMASRPEP